MALKVLLLGKQDNALFVNKKQLFIETWAKENIETISDPQSPADFAVALGGDGSLLSAIRKLGDQRHKMPILGIHLSPGLGFLHSLKYPAPGSSQDQEIQFATKVANLLKSGSFEIEKRWGLEASVYSANTEKKSSIFWAMNDVVISKGHISRILALDVSVNQNLILSNLKGDGLIVGSATGSTGYSLSAGGPVIDPKLKAMVITPVCPHRLSQRPFVLNSDAEIEIIIKPGKNDSYLTADGQSGLELDDGDVIKVSSAKEPTLWISPQPNGDLPIKNYFESLRTKLGFGGDS